MFIDLKIFIFEIYDLNNDKNIDKDELRIMVRELGI